MNKIFTALGFLFLTSVPLLGQGNSGRTVNISTLNDLSFGTIAVGPLGGSIAVNADGSTTQSGAYPAGGVIAPAEFRVELHNGRRYTIILPTTATLTGSGGTLTLDAFVSNPAGTGLVDKPDDIGKLSVGARLNIPSGATGYYEGEYLVTVTLFE